MNLTGQREFSARLVLELARRPGNLLVSPYSVWCLLALLHPGARGETRDLLEQALGIDEATTGSKWAETIDELSSANALWAQQGYPLEPGYVREVRKRFRAQIEELDLTGNPTAACDTINAWANDNTHGKIPHVLFPAEIDPLTRLILANATYFKDDWLHPFDQADTTERPFHRRDGSKVEVQMMHQEARLLYFKNRRFQAVRLPYEKSGLSMTVVLPRKIRKFEAKLTPDRLEALFKAPYGEKSVFLALPRYRFESTLHLVDSLSEQGLGPLFGPSADLSGLSKEHDVFVNKVKQVNFVEIDEEGTEAAAVTIAMVAATASLTAGPGPKVMIVDRPYWFFIRDDRSGIMLFAGRVEDPS